MLGFAYLVLVFELLPVAEQEVALAAYKVAEVVSRLMFGMGHIKVTEVVVAPHQYVHGLPGKLQASSTPARLALYQSACSMRSSPFR